MGDYEKIRQVARESFGFDQLRPGQAEAVASLMKGRDTLVVQPTGSGKSAIYQIAGLLIRGSTVVVSPLIALQKDQLDSILANNLADAAVVNSARRASEIRETFEKFEGGDMEFLFLSPEQFANEKTRSEIIRNKPSLFVIDEAHCISEWGHDFRPDYLKLGAVIDMLGHPPVLALTATAAPAVRGEIVERLHMRNPKIFVRGFDRPNISLSVRAFETEAKKLDALLEAVDAAPKPGIVYCSTRRNVEKLLDMLTDRGVSAVGYHGGMKAKERDQLQNEFMSGQHDVIVATNAFGMGVDKSDVRFVFHAGISDSIDAYYQEIGRAGRDGQPAKAVLFYRPEDLHIHKFLKGGRTADDGRVKRVLEMVRSSAEPVAVAALREATELSVRAMTKVLNRLRELGAVRLLADGTVSAGDNQDDAAVLSKHAVEQQENRKQFEKLRLDKMQTYAEIFSCRREYLLTYFGDEDTPAKCEGCDNCLGENPAAKKPAAAASASTVKPKKPAAVSAEGPYPAKTRVQHRELGRGVVEGYDGDKVIVLFDAAGRKRLSLQFVQDNGLLEVLAS